MPQCPDCGGELVVSADGSDSRGVERVFECENCNELFEPADVETN